MVESARQLTGMNAEIMQLRAQLGLDADATPQDDFEDFLEGTDQLSDDEREYREWEAQEQERDYLRFLRSSGQVPAEHPPQADFNQFLEASNQLTPRALRAAEREYRESEKEEQERDYLSFLRSSGQVPAEHPPQEDFEEFLETTKQLTPKALRAAEREYREMEEEEEEEDFAQFLAESGQVLVPPSDAPLDGVLSSDDALAALERVTADIAALRAELGLEDTPQDDFNQFLEASNQLTPRALRAAEREYRESEKEEQERDYLSFLRSSGQVPAEHPPQEDFEEFLETTKQLTPKALRAAEREYREMEKEEEEEDFAQFLAESGQIRFPVPASGGGSIEDVLSSAEQDILRLRRELGTHCGANTARRTAFLSPAWSNRGTPYGTVGG